MQREMFSKIWKGKFEKAFSSFRNSDNFRTKDEQGQYLQSLIDVVAMKRRRKSTKDRLQNDREDPEREFSYEYHGLFSNVREQV